MRLLYVSHSLPPAGRPMENIGGMQRVAADLHESLERHPRVELRSLILRSSWSERGYRTPIFLARALREMRRLVRRREIDAILFSSMVTATLSVPLRNLLNRSGILSAAIVNGLDATTPVWPYPMLVRKTFAALDLVMPISRATEDACAVRGLARGKSRVISLGIRTERFSPPHDSDTARRKISPRGSFTICSVGRLVPRKGVAWFIANVMPLLPDDVTYIVVGDGPDHERIRKLVAQYGLEESVVMAGTVSDEQLADIYAAADLFAMPNVPVANDMEGFGLVMVEAGLAGLPVIASRLEGIADVIEEGANGHLVESGDAGQFRDAILRYYADRDSLRALGSRAREHTVRNFSWSNVTDTYIAALEELLQQHRTEDPGLRIFEG